MYQRAYDGTVLPEPKSKVLAEAAGIYCRKPVKLSTVNNWCV